MPRKKKEHIIKRVFSAIGRGVGSFLLSLYKAHLTLLLLALTLTVVEMDKRANKRLDTVRLQVASISYKNFSALDKLAGHGLFAVDMIIGNQRVLAGGLDSIYNKISQYEKPAALPKGK